MSERLKILLVEDSEPDAELLRYELRHAAIEHESRRVDTQADFERELKAFRPDVILSDLSMPRFNGMAALGICQQLNMDVPFIFVSGTIGEDAAVEAMKAGAHDYVMKGNLARLAPAVQRELREARARQARTIAEAGLHRAQLMAKLAHVITAPDGAFESWSETLPQLIGAQRDQIPASTREWLDLLHPDDRAAFRAGSIEARTRHERKDVDYRLRHNGGAWIHVRQTMEPLGADTQSAGESRWFNTLQDVTQQVRAESDLRRSEAKFRTLIGQAADGIFVTDSRGQFLLANSRYCEMLGYSEEELLRMNVADTFPEAERAQARQRIPQLREVKNRLYERRMHRKDGSSFSAEISVHAIGDGSHQGIARDISERRRMEQELHRFRLALDNSADIVVIVDRASMRFADVNRSACELLGYTREEMLSMGPQDILPVSREALEKAYDELISTPALASGMTSDYRCKDGSRLPFESTRRVLRSGDAWLVVVVSRDIRERIAAGQSLQESAALKSAILASSLDAMVTIDHSGRIIEFNSAAEAMFGHSREQALGKPIAETIIPPHYRDAHRRGFARYLATGEGPVLGKRIEIEAVRADGTEFPVELAITPIKSGATPLFTAFIRDITVRKEAEAKIRRLNRVYAVLSGINSLIVRARAREELYRESCRIAVEAGELRLAWIGVVDRKEEEIVPAAFSGVEEGWLGIIRLSTREDSGRFGIAGRALRDRIPIVSNDLLGDERALFRKESAERGYRSLAMIPLIVDGEAFGVLGLHGAEVGFFDQEEMKLLLELASDIAFGLKHIEQEEKVRHLTRVQAVLSGINAAIVRVRNRDELFREACRIAVEAGKFPKAWIGMVERDSLAVKLIAGHGAEARFFENLEAMLEKDAAQGQGVVAQAVRERQPVISNDLQHDPRVLGKENAAAGGSRSLVVLPLIVAQAVAGVLVLHADVPGFFDDAEMRLLLELAGDIAFAIEHIAKSEELDYLAYYDVLTGLANRTLFLERMEQQVAAARHAQQKLAVFLLDIERFKSINDAFGRHAGDQLLKQISERMLRAGMDPTRLARIGADHFGVMGVDMKTEEEIGRLTESRLEQIFEQPFAIAGNELRVSGKVGIALFPDDGADAESLFRNAEAALKKAKASGERYLFHTEELTARVADQLSLENKLRQALEREEFVLYYQPKVDLETRAVVGVEALIRWQSPDKGLVPPAHFIPLLEETGLILQVGEWALKRAARDHRRWVEQKLKAPRVAVNVSAIQLRQRDFVRVVEDAIIDGVAPTAVDLEITESLVMEDIKANIEKLKAVRALGVNLAVDDFGTGYSSLGYLAQLPVQALKIDRSFIIKMGDDPNAMTLVSTIISLAHSLRLKVVAEGVETEDQAKFLRLLRCDEMQGYLFSKPVPVEALVALLRGTGN